MGRKKKDTAILESNISHLPKHRFSDERVRMFLQIFARESEYVRESIVKDLPAYNALLSLQVFSFEELALQYIADIKGIKYDPEQPPQPICPYCDSENVGRKKYANSGKENLYRCYDCSRTFSANYNSISTGTKCSALTWMKLLQCLLNFIPIAKTCEYCDISETTYYNLRNRIFHAMQILLTDVKLYGNIEVDNTFVRTSYKGVNLQESEFPEESIFFDSTFKPRDAKKRGCRSLNIDKNANNICVFTAIDDRGHVMTRFVGVGVANYLSLKSFLPADKYLKIVPEQDPFMFHKSKSTDSQSIPGDSSRMIADKEHAIKKYAETVLEIPFESHVYRKGNVQFRLAEDTHHIQHVNALHRRLKTFLRNCNYVSSKYLPGYLTLFEFIENTGGSPQAIQQLFRILAQPNLGRPANFYQEMFSVPNYLEIWLNNDHPLKKLPYNKLLAFYLFDHIRNKELYPNTTVSMQFIEEESGYTAPTIRRIYRELNDAGYRDLILSHFGEPQTKATIVKNKFPAPTSLNPTVLLIYDEYAKIRTLPFHLRPTFQQFLDEKNKQYGTQYKRTNMLAKFKIIEERGIRPPMPEYTEPVRLWEKAITNTMLSLYADYEKIILGYRQRGETLPVMNTVYEELSKKYGLTANTVGCYIHRVRVYKKNNPDN